jgi:pyruvate-ferredoxin/flavodoxin oxidoreductase
MGKSIEEEGLAAKAGYWANFRFNPANDNPFTLDTKAPTDSYEDFIMGEVRYNSLKRANPERAARLFAKSEAEAKEDTPA